MTSKISDYQKRKTRMHEHLGGRCMRCGSSNELHIDHIDPDSKSFDISSNWAISWERLVIELDKCQLLCSKHHIEKSKKEGSLAKGRRYGADSNFAKLSSVQVEEIRSKYVPYKYSCARLAAEYGVSHGAIKNIVTGRSWQ